MKHVLDKFRHKLPKDELKRLGKEIAKKLVASDYKNNRVGDPAAPLSEKQTLKIKKYVKDFLARAVEKYEVHHKQQGSKDASSSAPTQDLQQQAQPKSDENERPHDASDSKRKGDEDIANSDIEDNDESPGTQERKRKREAETTDGALGDSADATPSEGPSAKRQKGDDDALVSGSVPSPPPPPPPPPDSTGDTDADADASAALTEEQKALQEQEEALMRENEEAQRLEDEANRTKNMEDAGEEMRKDIALAA